MKEEQGMRFNKWYGPVLIALIVYTLAGLVILTPSKSGLDAKTGLVWNALNTGAEKINALQSQVKAPTDLVKQVMTNLATARNDILAAQATGDLTGALNAYDRANVEVSSLTEAYPNLIDLGPLYVTLMDETSGAFNRVSYARSELINAQASYNVTCSMFIISCPFIGGRVQVVGANTNPAAPMQITPMAP